MVFENRVAGKNQGHEAGENNSQLFGLFCYFSYIFRLCEKFYKGKGISK